MYTVILGWVRTASVAKTYAIADATVVFENQIGSPFGACMADEPLRVEAKILFELEWASLADASGVLTEIDEVFVGVGWAIRP